MDTELMTGFNEIKNAKVFDVTALTGAYYFVTRPEFQVRWERYDFSQLILVLKGSGTYTTEHGSYPFGAGCMIHRPAFAKSKYEWDMDDVEFALIDFVCDSGAMSAFGEEPMPLPQEERATLFDLMKTAARVCEPIKQSEGGSKGQCLKKDVPQVVLGFLYASLERFLSMVYCRIMGIDLLLDESQKVSGHLWRTKLVTEVKEYLAAHVCEKLSLADLCAHFWVGQTTLTRKFKKETGQGLIDYFTDLKIEHARAVIATSAVTFTELAERLGFSSVGYFSKLFKARVGMTPTAYSRYVSKRRIV